ncbi:17583_t:CDS:10 [Acaulospora morrowiae]|uniref:17583_t:CDS:1 n=1 Tax=Acaulospora morrowiae TaxID=94023 RepID=A0A9N8VIH3_9GLOM|nr:17583_t:CDS:10 [Acaulospora morrowiae]
MQFLDLSEPLLVYALLGGFILFYGLVSLIVKEKLYISEALVATSVGVIIGPACLQIINPREWSQLNVITEELTRIVLAFQVMTAAINLPRAYITRQYRSMAIMLIPVMSFMWIVSAAIIYYFIQDLTFIETLLIAACITPTDPILANSVVQGSFAEKHIPSHVRYLLSAESGINDESPRDTGTAINKWVWFVWGYHILFSVVIGCFIGWAARKLLRLAESRDWIDKESFLVFAFALAIFVVGVVSILGSDALLACFMAGTSFSWDDWFREETRDAKLQDVIDLLLNLTTFQYIGMIIPWSSFNSEYIPFERLLIVSILILIFRRLPIVLLLKKFIPAIHTFKEALFAGYFGPIGVGAIFLAVTVEKEINKNLERESEGIDREAMLRTREIVFPIVAFIVISSVLVHGITVPILNIGSKIDMERFPSIASISSQVARLPVIDFVENLALERDSTGRVGRKKKMKAEFDTVVEVEDESEEERDEREDESDEEDEDERDKIIFCNVQTNTLIDFGDENDELPNSPVARIVDENDYFNQQNGEGSNDVHLQGSSQKS